MTEAQKLEAKEHYDNPKNNKALKVYNAKGIGKNPDNFGMVEMTLLVEDEIIKEIGYEFKGCPTIAFNSSIFSETVKNETMEEALDVANDLLNRLNGSEMDDECPKMVLVSFQAAFQNYTNNKNGEEEKEKVLFI